MVIVGVVVGVGTIVVSVRETGVSVGFNLMWMIQTQQITHRYGRKTPLSLIYLLLVQEEISHMSSRCVHPLPTYEVGMLLALLARQLHGSAAFAA